MFTIAHITSHGCIRAHKMAMAQQNMGHKCHFIAGFIAPTHSSTGYAGVHLYHEMVKGPGVVVSDQLVETVRVLTPQVDLFHVHNEPNWIFRAVKENTSKPVIWDIHDWTSIRPNPISFEVESEKWALANADAFVVPSKGYLRKIREESKKPSILIHSLVPQFLYPEEPVTKKPGLAYEGGLKGIDANDLYNFSYRNWAEFVRIAVDGFKNGNKAYLYSANGGDDFSQYKHEKIEFSYPQMYDQLLRSLSQHTAGLVGSPYKTPDFADSMPNKLFEYVSAGIPVIVVNSKEASEFVEQHDLGVSVQDASEVGEALEKLKGHNLQRERWKYTMESEIPALLSLYQEVCGHGKRVIAQV